MSTITKEIVIPEDRRINIELPPDVIPGKAVIKLTIEQKRPNRVGELFGAGKEEEVWMADDFDAPMEDFKDYM